MILVLLVPDLNRLFKERTLRVDRRVTLRAPNLNRRPGDRRGTLRVPWVLRTPEGVKGVRFRREV
jgi:hypothetical protein